MLKLNRLFFFPEKEKNKKLTKQTNVWQETQKRKEKNQTSQPGNSNNMMWEIWVGERSSLLPLCLPQNLQGESEILVRVEFPIEPTLQKENSRKKVLKKLEKRLSKQKFENVRPVRTVAEQMLNKP